MLSTQLKSLTDLRNNPLLISQLAADSGPVYILNRSRPAGVFISPQQYDEMIDLIDDYLDVQDIRIRRKTAQASDLIPLEEIEKEYGLK